MLCLERKLLAEGSLQSFLHRDEGDMEMHLGAVAFIPTAIYELLVHLRQG